MGGDSCTVLRLRLMHKLAMSHTMFSTGIRCWSVLVLRNILYNFQLSPFITIKAWGCVTDFFVGYLSVGIFQFNRPMYWINFHWFKALQAPHQSNILEKIMCYSASLSKSLLYNSSGNMVSVKKTVYLAQDGSNQEGVFPRVSPSQLTLINIENQCWNSKTWKLYW